MSQENSLDPRAQALKLLARRDYSEAKMRQKLAGKGFAAAAIAETLAWLKAKNLVDDREYAGAFVRSTLSQKNVGRRWLVFKLRQKGISGSNVEAALAAEYPAEKEAEFRQAAAASWKRAHRRDADNKVKLVRFLMGRGFSATTTSP